MAAYGVRAGYFGWAGAGLAGEKATFQSGGSSQVQLDYARALRAAPDFAQITCTVNGVSRGITAVSVGNGPWGNNTRLSLTLASATSAAPPKDKLIITYVPGATAGTRLAYAPNEEIAGGSVPVQSS